jgi:hypothetical protein
VNWKGFGRKRRGFIEMLSRYFPEGTKEHHEKLQENLRNVSEKYYRHMNPLDQTMVK